MGKQLLSVFLPVFFIFLGTWSGFGQTCTASVSISSNDNDNNICAGTQVIFTATPTNGGGNPLYQWRVNGVNVDPNSPVNTYTTTTLQNGQVVSVRLTSDIANCGAGNPVVSNNIATTVNPISTVSAGGTIAAICQGGTTTALGGSFGGGATSAVWSDGGAGGSFTNNSGSNPGSTTYTALSSAPASITLTLTTAGGSCGSVNATKNLTIMQNPTLSAGGSISAICQGGTTTVLGGSFGGGATSAVWSDGGAGGSFTNNSGSNPGSATYTASATAPASITLTLTTAGESCGTVNTTKSLTVNPNPTVNTGGSISVFCQGGTTAALAGSYGGGATSAIWSDGGAGGSFTNNNGSNPGNTTYTASASAPASITLTLTSAGGSCGIISATKTLNINPNPTVSAGGAISAICQGGTTSTLGGSFGGGATSAVWTANVTGGTFSNNTGTTPNTTTYTAATNAPASITLTLTTAGGSCGTVNATKNLTINQIPTVNAGGSITAICQGGTTAALGGSFGGGATSAVWTANVTGGTFSNNTGTTPGTTTYTASPSAPASTILTLTTSGGSCGTVNATKTLSVNPTVIPSVTITASSTSICTTAPSGSIPVTFSATPINGGASPNYQWKNGGANVGTNSATYIANSLANGSQISVIMTSNFTCASTSPVTSNSITMTGYTPPSAPVFSPAPSINGPVNTTLLCPPNNGLVYTVTSDPNVTNYNWTLPTGWVITAGTGTNSITINNSNQQKGNYNLIVTAQNACGNNSKTLPITIDDAASVYAGADASICTGSSYNLSDANMTGYVATNGNNAPTWTVNPSGSGTFNNNRLVNATFTPSISSGTITLTLTSTKATGNFNCAVLTDQMILTVNAPATAVGGTAVTACSNAAVNITAGSSATNNSGILWTSNGTGTIANPTSLTTATYTPGANETGPVTLTLTATGNAPCVNAVSTKTLTIAKAPTAVAGTAVTACSNSAVNITSGASATNSTGIIWTSNGTGTIANPTSLTTATYTPGANETGPVTLTLTATGNAPCVNAVSTKTLTISAAASAVSGTAITACSNSTVNITSGSSATNYTGVIWTSNGTGTIANPTSLTTATYTPGANETGAITLTLTATGNTPCGNAISTKTLTISTAATSVAGNAVTSCSNSGAVNITGGSSATNNAGILWTSNGTGTIANPTSLTTASYAPGNGEIGVITLTLTATGNAPCGTVTSTKTLTISAAATAVAGIAVTTCSNSAAVNITSGSSATNNAGILWTSNGTGTIANSTSLTTATYTPGANETGPVTLTLTANGNTPCTNTVSTKTLTISTAATAVAGTAVTTCSNSVVNITSGASATNNSGIIWTSNGTGTIANPTSLSTATYTPGSGETGTITLTLTATGNAPCGNAVSTKNLSINQEVSITTQPVASQTICSGFPVSLSVSATGTGLTYEWSKNGTSLGITTPTLSINQTTLANAGTYKVKIKGTAPCAEVSSQEAILIVNENITINTQPTNVEDCEGNSVTFQVLASGNISGYEWRKGGIPISDTGNYSGTKTNKLTISSLILANAGNYDVVISSTDDTCSQTISNPVNLKVNPISTISLTSAGGSDNQIKCISTAITPIIYTVVGSTGASITSGTLPAGVSGVYNAEKFTISGTPTEAGTFNYTVTTAGGCTNVALSGTIKVDPNNTVNLTSAANTNTQTLCVNTQLTDITYATTGATGATFSGLPAGVTGGWAGNVVTISGTPTVTGPFNYTVTLTGGCSVVAATGTINVSPINSITRTSAASTSSQTICVNTAITNITYSTTGATGASFSGLPTGVTGGWADNVVTISGTPTLAGGPFNYTVTLSGGCSVITATGTINVTPNNTISLSSAAATTTQTLCINTQLTNITYATTGATGATFTGLPAGVTGGWAGNVITISGTPTVAGGPFNYTITLTGGCSVVTATGTINVTSNNTVSLTSAANTNNQTLCVNTPITNIKYATTGATGASFSELPAGVTGSWSGNVVTISGTPTVASGPPNYTITLTGGCSVVTATGTINVNPNNTISLTSAANTNTQTLCINTPLTNIKYTTTGATGATFTGLPAGVTGSWAGNMVTISGTPTVAGSTSNYIVTLTGGCSAVTATGTIKVDPVPVGGDLLFTKNNERIYLSCVSPSSSNSLSAITISGHSGTISTWKYRKSSASTWATLQTGGTSITAAQIHALGITESIVFQVEISSGSCTPNALSQTAILSVIPSNIKPAPVKVDPAVVCKGEEVTLSSSTGYGETFGKFDGGAFDNAGIKNKGWRFSSGDFDGSLNNGRMSEWGRMNPHGGNAKVFTANIPNPIPSLGTMVDWDSSSGNSGNKGFGMVTGNRVSLMETPVFSLTGLDEAILTFDQAYNLTAGAKILVEISTDGGSTYSKVLFSITGDGTINTGSSGNYTSFGDGNPTSRPKNKMVIDLGNYLGQSNLRIRFNFRGVIDGDVWAVDNIKVPEGPQDIILEWRDFSDPVNFPNGEFIGNDNSEQWEPKLIGWNKFEVKTAIILDSNGQNCSSVENSQTIRVFVFDRYTTTITANAGTCGNYVVNLTANATGAFGRNVATYPTKDGYIGEWVITKDGAVVNPTTYTLVNTDNNSTLLPKNNPNARFEANNSGEYTFTWKLTSTAIYPDDYFDVTQRGKVVQNNGCPPVITPTPVQLQDCTTLDFDGIDDYVDLGTNYTGNLNSSTIEAWIRPKATTGTVISGPGFAINMVDIAPFISTNGRWYHIAIISGVLHVDGVDTKKTISGVGGNKTLIGAKWDAATKTPINYYSGWIEEVRIWKKILTIEQVRFMMNQHLQNAPNMGEEIPMPVPGGLSYADLDGYYRLISAQPDPLLPTGPISYPAALMPNNGNTPDLAINAIPGRLHNMITNQQNTAPMPYLSKQDGIWTDTNTWLRPTFWDIPNSTSQTKPIEWNIVRTFNNITSGSKDITVLGLKSETLDKRLEISGPGTKNEYNTGQMIRVTHYLELDGNMDLVGESQLLQDQGSILAETSKGWLKRDQQGKKMSFNYNYWSSPVSAQGAANNVPYLPKDVMNYGWDNAMAGTVKPLVFTADSNPYGADNTIMNTCPYWLWRFHGPADDYDSWIFIGKTGTLNTGEGHTMKGTTYTGTADYSHSQNYGYKGKPHNGNITLGSVPDENYLIGNPYPSALDANEFILDNLKSVAGGRNNKDLFNGVIYFWDHFSGATHILREYIGGYAVLNLIDGVPAISTDERINANDAVGGKTPTRYIPVGQGFFVNSGTDEQFTGGVPFSMSIGDLTFKNSQRVFSRENSGNSIFLKPENVSKTRKEEAKNSIPKIRISFKSPKGYNRQLLVGAHPSTTNGFDLGYDAPMIEYNPEDMYWLQEGNFLVIQGVPDFGKEQILPLGVRIEKAGEFTIKIDTLENVGASQNIYLRDILLDTIHDIKADPYVSTAEPGEITDRFQLIFYKEKAELPIEEPIIIDDKTEISLLHSYRENEMMVLNPQELSISAIYLFDLNGKLLYVFEDMPSEKEIILKVGSFSEGIYILKMHTDNEIITRKIIIKK